MNSNIWTICQQRLEREIAPQQYNTWIRPLELVAEDGYSLNIAAPNAVIRGWAEQNYADIIRQVLQDLSDGQNRALRFVVKGNNAATTGPAAVPSNGSSGVTGNGHRGSPMPNGFANGGATGEKGVRTPSSSEAMPGSLFGATASLPSTEFSFENYVEGPSNQMALINAQGILDRLGEARHNPFVICGGVGLGKTHLMHAIGNMVIRRHPNMNVVCRSTEDFVNDMIRCLKQRAMDEFHRFYRQAHLLLLDDVQFFAGKEKSQTEVFHTIESLREHGGQLVITCDKYPSNIRELESRLRSRFSQGLTSVIEAPDLETRAAILSNKAAQERVNMPEDCALYIADKISSNVRELQGALNRVMATANFRQCGVDLPLVKEALGDLIVRHGRGPGIDEIKKRVAAYYGIQPAMLDTRRRTRTVVRPRQMAMALARELTPCSLPEIGAAFGGRDHTTVLHACNIIKGLRSTHVEINDDYRVLLRELRE